MKEADRKAPQAIFEVFLAVVAVFRALPTFWGNSGLDGALVEVRTGS